MQSLLLMHLPQLPIIEPPRKQKGWLCVQGSVAPDPASPLHGTQVDFIASQIGVVPLHCDELVHWTQTPDIVLHTGVGALQSEFMRHPTQTSFGPHFCERHTVPPFIVVHGPSPFA
jgi:hypothetical protein